MEVPAEPPAGARPSPPPGTCAGVRVSQELLTAGSGGGRGIWDRLLLRPEARRTSTLQTQRVAQSPLLDQVQSFLPRLAEANEQLRAAMAAAPPGHFDIENTDGSPGHVVQMDVALFEMNQADPGEDGSEEDAPDSSGDSSDSDSEGEGRGGGAREEVTVDNIKLPRCEAGRGKIEVLDGPASKRRKDGLD